MKQGKIIVLEGADGTGKSTQRDLLKATLDSRGIPCAVLSFPRYDTSFFGALAGRMLKGDLGESKDIPAHLATLPFACDRWLAKAELTAWLTEGKLVLIDRYTASSAVYQAAKMPDHEQKKFISWVYQMEYDVIGLPKEDITFCFHLPVAIAQTLIDQKEQRSYLGNKKKDMYEANSTMQETVSRLYAELAEEFSHWHTIECAVGGIVRTPAQIHKDIVDELTRNGVL